MKNDSGNLQSIAEAVEEIIKKYAPRRLAVELKPETRLIEEAGIDSARMVDITLDIEDKFNITLEDGVKAATFGDLLKHVQLRVNQI